MNREDFIKSYVLREIEFVHVLSESNFDAWKNNAQLYVNSVVKFLTLSNQEIPDYLIRSKSRDCWEEMANQIQESVISYRTGHDC